MSTATIVPDTVEETWVVDDTTTIKAPVCEASPQGRACYRPALYSALITPHGCRRDNKMLLLCQQCYDAIRGGSVCAYDELPIWIVRAVSL